MLWRVLILVLLFNGLMLAAVAHQLSLLVPAARVVSENRDSFESSLGLLDTIHQVVSNASVRLFHGSIASLANDFVTSDVNTAASVVVELAESVHKATCRASPEGDMYDNTALFGIAKYSDLVRSISDQIALVPPIPQSAEGGANKVGDIGQLSGEGGLLLDTLIYVTDFVSRQTDTSEWAQTACNVAKLSDTLQKHMVWKGSYGPECGKQNFGDSMAWDVSEDALSNLKYIQQTALELCKLEPHVDAEDIGDAAGED